MPCNCGKKASARGWVYTSPGGQTIKYPTEVQAKAAVIRNGGGTAKPA